MPISKAILSALLLLALACAREQPVSEEVQSELQRTIMNANMAVTRAARTNDAKIMSRHISGELFEVLSESIERAKKRGTYTVSELQDLRWGKMRVEGDSAEVVTTERWRHTHYALGSDKCVMVFPTSDLVQTYRLEKGSRGWTIKKSDAGPGSPRPKPSPCPT
ncbi:MAG TPA: hypothetical protein VIW92_03640 [Thermoanaerobaculia bacterium]